MDVSIKLNAALKRRNDGMPSGQGSGTVAAFVISWLEDTKSSLRYSTWKRYSDMMRRHVLPVFGKQQMTKLTPQHLQRLYAVKLAEGLSPTTVHHLHAVIHRALETALRWDLEWTPPVGQELGVAKLSYCML